MAKNEEVVVGQTEVKSDVAESPKKNVEGETDKVKPDVTQGSEKRGDIPYERFREVNEERKQFKAKLEEYDRRFKELESKSNPDKAKTSSSEYFKKKGYDDETAKALGEAMDEMLSDRLEPVNKKLGSYEIMENVRKNYDTFKQSHNDLGKYESKMNEIFSSLPTEIQQALASDPMGLELLYAKAKDGEQQDLYEKGKEDATKNVRLKKDGASLKGVSSNGNPKKMTMDDMKNMSEEERRENWDKLIEGYQNKGE